ncbi:TonB-dependent receptor plug domain-containing protein [Paucibacter sp. R3-3]|uniref:TonB-dependent receptor plug domain-containing protein n=1 Tax=Roseateles agri TaxID=3098619 RepID=A0ABU5DJC2_9BURK|nr:TonB-dependent receptor plug domain-containing protein [Paucibacter sp. R3-3]MDY0746398.1 TonB-dependent receptor plug domain-containing protein [Paucibacter sp. R3-3]
MRHALPAALFSIVLAASLARADDSAPSSSPDELSKVIVNGQRERVPEQPATEATTVIDATTIERRQAATIFDAVQDVPGVSADGGPRATGMKFNIRGFRNNDDVLFKIDGGVKGFEKYRFGSGVFIEPELIKSITVERGPSIVSGSGAVGGTIAATTKSAADFLRPGERAGGLVKLGYNDNNNERLTMLTVFGRPTDRIDLLASTVRREAGDFKLANGSRFPASASDTQGSLLKLGLAPLDDLLVDLSRTAFTSGPTYTPFDANSSNAQVGGYVHQDIDDATTTLGISYEPRGLPWLRLRGSFSDEQTKLVNLMRPGESSFAVACTTDPCTWNALGGATGDVRDHWRYRIRTAELFNNARWSQGELRGTLTLGVQTVRNERVLKRLTDNPLMNGPDGKYPDGYDSQQPPGIKRSVGWVAQNAFEWRTLLFTAGVRKDRYDLTATGQAAADLNAVGESPTQHFEHTSPSVMLGWRPGNGDTTLSWRWAKSFRPPLITDYFGTGAASPCAGLIGITGQLAPYGCGDRIRPALSLNREWTLAWQPRWSSGARTQARLTYFEIDTQKLNGANYLTVVDDLVVQPWSERRRGLELEVNHEARDWYASFNASQIKARRMSALDGTDLEFTSGIPGTTASASTGLRLFEGKLELGYRVRQIWNQLVIPGATALTESTQYCGKVTSDGVVHAANTQQEVYAFWRPWERLAVQVGVHNLFDKHWCNNGDELGNIIGLQGPGRSVRTSMTLQF